MSLPKAVAEMGARADALHQNLIGGNQPAPTPEPTPAPAANGLAPEQTPVVAPAPAPQVDSTPTAPERAPEPDTNEHRYKVLQGKYNAEVPQLRATAEAATRRVADLERIVSELTEQLKAIPAESKSLVRPEEIAEHGEGLVDVMRRTALEQLAERDQRIASLENRLSQLLTGVEKTQQLGFFEVLGRDHPDWSEINGLEQFHKWLDERDVISGTRRQDLLEAAQASKDGARASAIFAAFKKDRDSWAAKANLALSNQVVPAAGSAGAAPVGQATSQRIWTRLEISQAYDQMRRGVLKGDEAKATEAEIQRAIAEQRVK